MWSILSIEYQEKYWEIDKYWIRFEKTWIGASLITSGALIPGTDTDQYSLMPADGTLKAS